MPPPRQKNSGGSSLPPPRPPPWLCGRGSRPRCSAASSGPSVDDAGEAAAEAEPPPLPACCGCALGGGGAAAAGVGVWALAALFSLLSTLSSATRARPDGDLRQREGQGQQVGGGARLPHQGSG